MSLKAKLNKRDEKFLNMSLNDSVLKVVLYVGTPLAFYQMLSQIFAVLDTMMAAHISKESVSAVAYLSQLSHLLSAVGGGLAVGSSIQISRAFGAGDYVMVKKRISSLYILCLAIGLLMLGAILPFTGSFLRFAGTPEALIAVGTNYFIVQLFTMVISFLNNVYIAVERARGNAKLIFRLNFTVISVKLALTAFFVYILNGDLVMIAVASLISQFVLLIFAVRNSLNADSAFGFSLKAVTKDREVNGPMISSSLPVIAEKGLFAFGKTIINSMCTLYGDLMVGAMGVSNNLGGFTTMPQNGYQEGSASVISQNFGARKYKRVLDIFWVTLIINAIIGAVISSLELWQIDFMASLFDSGSLEFHEMIKTVYRYEAFGAVPLGINAAVMALLYGLGKTKLTLILNIARVFIFRIPVFWFLQNFTALGEKSVGIVMMVSNISVTVMAVAVAALVIREYKSIYPLDT
jgi:putative MATE family efflux protein